MDRETNYLKAKEDMTKALISFSKLNGEQQRQLLSELTLATTCATFLKKVDLFRNH